MHGSTPPHISASGASAPPAPAPRTSRGVTCRRCLRRHRQIRDDRKRRSAIVLLSHPSTPSSARRRRPAQHGKAWKREIEAGADRRQAPCRHASANPQAQPSRPGPSSGRDEHPQPEHAAKWRDQLPGRSALPIPFRGTCDAHLTPLVPQGQHVIRRARAYSPFPSFRVSVSSVPSGLTKVIRTSRGPISPECSCFVPIQRTCPGVSRAGRAPSVFECIRTLEASPVRGCRFADFRRCAAASIVRELVRRVVRRFTLPPFLDVTTASRHCRRRRRARSSFTTRSALTSKCASAALLHGCSEMAAWIRRFS